MGIDLIFVILSVSAESILLSYRFFVALLLRMTSAGASCRANVVSAGIRTSDKAERLQRGLAGKL